MNWPDERYVRLYTRDTVTWKRWTWQTRAVMVLLLRKVDRSGVLDTGARDKAEAFALLLEVPVDVAAKAIFELLESGTMVESATGFVLPAFMEAQESRQSDAARQRESRERRRTANLRNTEAPCHTPSHAVTDGHNLSLQPSRAVPSRAVPSTENGADAPPPRKAPKAKRAEQPADPRHQPLVKALDEAFREARGTAYPYKPRDFAAVKALLAAGTPEVILAAWRKALAHRGYPSVSSPSELHQHLAHFVGTAAAPVDKTPHVVGSWTPEKQTTMTEGF